MRWVDLEHLGSEHVAAVKQILAYAVGDADEDRLSFLLNEAYRHPSRKLWALVDSGLPVAMIGYERTSLSKVTILHIAVAPSARGRGLGRAMIDEVANREGADFIGAETDSEAVDFYRKCGFTVKSLGEKYPGVERFRCSWSRPPQ